MGTPPSVQSDLYAFGVLVRELTGDRLEGDLAELVDRLTDADPALRPGSANEALAAIGPAAPPAPAPAPTETRPQTPAPSPSSGPPVRRNAHAPAAPVIAAGIVVLLVVAFVLSLGGGDGDGARDTPGGSGGGATAAGETPITLEGRLDQLDRIIRGEAP